MASEQNLSREQTRTIIRGSFNDLRCDEENGYLPRSNQPALELAEQRGLAAEFIRDTEQAIVSRNFSGSLLSSAATLSAAHGIQFEELPEDRKQDLLEGVARAMVEQQRLFIHRISDRLAPYMPVDPMFGDEVNCSGAISPCPPLMQSSLVGPTVKEAVSAYLDHGSKKWTLKTHAGRCRQLGFLEEHFEPDTLLAEINPSGVRGYREAIKRLRSNHYRTDARTFAAKQTDNQKHQISGKTASLMFEGVKAFFRWAADVEGYIPSNPAEKVRIEAPKKAKGWKPRRPFSKAELELLFTQPLFTGCASVKRRLQPGKLIIRDDYFWLPVLGFYTGARMGEIVQLHMRDVHLDGPTPHIEITDANSGGVGSGNAKHVKSAAGIRMVPLHPDVLELGFSDFLKSRSKHRKPTERLFHRVAFGSDGQASTVFSKWFARFLDKAGLCDPTLVYHSFRHAAEDAFRDALQPQYLIDRIIGHSDGSTSGGYGEGVSLETASAAVKAMKLKVHLPQLWNLSTNSQAS